MTRSLEGKTALVTGASKGLGRGMAVALGKAGASVALVSRDEGRLEEVAEEIRAAGGRAEVFAADVTDEDQVQRVRDAFAAKLGPKLGILVNNAGIPRRAEVAYARYRTKLPNTKILLLAVFPRGDKPSGKLGTLNEKLTQVNAILARLDDHKNIHFLDIGPKFTQGKDTLDKEIMPDFLHLSSAGYQIWADAIAPKLQELMR